MKDLTFYEFFAGGGMARAGLGEAWRCLLANDIDARKVKAYAENWGGEALLCRDVAALTPEDLPARADLAWASFPCQDLSLAGLGRGLGAAEAGLSRSGAFWPFWRLLQSLAKESRPPALVALENVQGLLTSNGGEDFTALIGALVALRYRVGALVIDARGFAPQSRPRVFVLAQHRDVGVPGPYARTEPEALYTPSSLLRAAERLKPDVRSAWLWWRLPPPALPPLRLEDILEDRRAVGWDPEARAAHLVASMTLAQRAQIEALGETGALRVGTLFRRTRPGPGPGAERIVRAEARFDGIAGCLRTPAGGSSRQRLIEIEGRRVRTRLLTPREAARLMGLPDSYRLPSGTSEALHLVGDGVAVPVVRHLAKHLLEPLLEGRPTNKRHLARGMETLTEISRSAPARAPAGAP